MGRAGEQYCDVRRGLLEGSALSVNAAACLVGHLIPVRLGRLAALLGIFFRKI